MRDVKCIKETDLWVSESPFCRGRKEDTNRDTTKRYSRLHTERDRRVHQRYPDPSIKIYFPGLTRETMLKELLVVKGGSGQLWDCSVPAAGP